MLYILRDERTEPTSDAGVPYGALGVLCARLVTASKQQYVARKHDISTYTAV